MSLLDLKSDLSKFRWKNPSPNTNTTTQNPKSSTYGDNFGAYQPISNTFLKSGKLPKPNEPKDIDLVGSLSTTKLDDVVKKSIENVLINTVSEFSPKILDPYVLSGEYVTLENITSNFSKIKTDTILSRIDKSNIIVTKTEQGTNNNDSKIAITKSLPENFDEKNKQSVDIIKEFASPINNILNPDIQLDKTQIDINWEAQSALIDKDVKIKDIIVNSVSNKLLNDSILNIDSAPEKFNTVSKIVDKKISQTVDTTKYTGQISELATENSKFDIEKISQTVLSGRHETDKNSNLSNKLGQELNYFSDNNASGFTNKTELLKTHYKNNTSEYGYDTLLETNYFDIDKKYTTDGFTAFAKSLESKYIDESSTYDWNGERINAPFVNYFDIQKNNTIQGFHTFASIYDTKYVDESSRFDWNGIRETAPFTDYFDITKQFTNTGFHTLAQTYDSKYIPESSRFDWNGLRLNAPTNDILNPNGYFDQTNQFTNAGFHTFAQKYDSKYIPESSEFDWNGSRALAPTNDFQNPNGYFDQTKRFTKKGFHTFAQTYDSKYIPESSRFDWDGISANAPTNDFQNPNGYFDQTNQFTSKGFHTFAQKYDSKFIPESSEFDWDGNRLQAPINDFQNPNGYFDQTKLFTNAGFHTFAQKYDSKFIPESSEFDWDGLSTNAPTNDFQNPNGYFDQTKRFTNAGFHIFAQKYDSKFIPESSEFDWDGLSANAPTNDILNPNGYFDQINQFTSKGFHTFAQKYDSKFIPESSEFDWDGLSANAPTNDFQNPNGYFDQINQFTSKGFHTFAQTYDSKYIPESSRFDWDGISANAPTNDFQNPNGYFDQTKRFTNAGFHTFAQTYDSKFITGSSRFDWDGIRSQAPTNDFQNPNGYFDQNSKFTIKGFHTFAQKYDSKFIAESSEFDWDGLSVNAPTNDILNPNGYFDQNKKFTSTGFHTFAQKYDSKFIPESSQFDWDGNRLQAPTNDFQNPNGYFDQNNKVTFRGFHILAQEKEPTAYKNDLAFLLSDVTNFDWDGANPYAQKPTRFFGFIPSEQYGFLIKMNQFDGTTYPIINPKLDYNIAIGSNQESLRRIFAGQRLSLEPLATKDLEKYVPLSLGNKSISGWKSTLDNQMPVVYVQKYGFNITSFRKRGKSVGTYIDFINNTSVQVQSKFIQNPSTVRYTDGGSIDSRPKIVDGNMELWANSQVPSPSDVVFSATDPSQILNAAQLVLLNRSYNGMPIYDGKVFKSHIDYQYQKTDLVNELYNIEYGSNRYEDVTVNLQLKTDNKKFDSFAVPVSILQKDEYNRLIALTKDLLPDVYSTIRLPEAEQPSLYFDMDKVPTNNPVSGILKIDTSALKLPTVENVLKSLGIMNKKYEIPKLNGNTTIRRLSTLFPAQGANSGYFSTNINRAKDPYKVVNSTGYFPTKENIIAGKDREVFYSGKTDENLRYGDQMQFNVSSIKSYQIYDMVANSTTPPLDNSLHQTLKLYLESLSRGFGDSIPVSLDLGERLDGIQRITLDRLRKQNPLNFYYTKPYEKFRAVTNNDNRFFVRKMSDGPNTVDLDLGPFTLYGKDAIKNYRTTDYLGLRNRNPYSRTKVSDFRKTIYESESNPNNLASFISNPDAIDFDRNNIENITPDGTGHGFGNPGLVGKKRNLPFVSNIQYSSLLNQKGLDAFDPNKTKNPLKSNYKFASYPVLKDVIKDSLQPGDVGFNGDRINIIDWKRSTKNLNKNLVYELDTQDNNLNKGLMGAEDLIQFYFSGANLKGSEFVPTEAIVFRAYLDTIVDNHKPSWTPIKYVGRADPAYSYDGYERDINFGFTVHIGSRDEMKATWRKLNMLASWTAPEYVDGRYMKAPVIRLNIGNLYRKFPGFLSALTYTFDNTQTTWETAKLAEDQNLSGENKKLTMPGVLELPKTISVQCTFVTFNIYRPEWDCVFYSLFDDSTGGAAVETGLVPDKTNDRVNYFKTFDDLDITHPLNSGLCAIIKDEPPKVEEKPKPAPTPEPTEIKKKPIICICRIEFCKDEDRDPIASSLPSIEKIAEWMKTTCPEVKIKLVGHASKEDKKPSAENIRANTELSKARAETIKRLLVEKGIDANRIQSDGVGFSQLIPGINADAAEQRRISIVVDQTQPTKCDVELNLDCKEGCPPTTTCDRTQIGDKSKFWIVGPGYFTEGPFPTKVDDTYEQGVGGFYKPKTGVTPWKLRYPANSTRIRSWNDNQVVGSNTPNSFGTFIAPP